MITTFYSFKGGVGRTLALANAAWLLANHSTESARVLVIDFDLAAPGLHRVLPPEEDGPLLGLTDYVHSFLTSAAVAPLTPYIHKTKYPRIDIMPAGMLDSTYQNKLDAISWRTLYEHAYGYEFIEAFRRSLRDLKYDYILIDSLTGYSDIGGICVHQLPDAVVLLFRLNQQNLDGIKSVYEGLRTRLDSKERRSFGILPVVSPAWPFIDKAAKGWYLKANRIFSGKQLLQISFDSSLSFGESLVVDGGRISGPKRGVVDDYRELADSLRALNPNDPITLWREIASSSHLYPPESFTTYRTLLMRRPAVARYWSRVPLYLTFASIRKGAPRGLKGPGPIEAFVELVEEQCRSDNKFALVARAESRMPDQISEAISDLSTALDIDPDYTEALAVLGRAHRMRRETGAAVNIYTKLLNLLPAGSPDVSSIYSQLGALFMESSEPHKAIEYLLRAAESPKILPGVRKKLAYAYYWMGELDLAATWLDRFREIDPTDETARLLAPQLNALLGNVNEAVVALEEATASSYQLNVAEAWLSIDPMRTLSILEKISDPDDEDSLAMWGIKLIADILLGRKPDIEKEVSKFEQTAANEQQFWHTFEIAAMARYKRESGKITEQQFDAIRRIWTAIERSIPSMPD